MEQIGLELMQRLKHKEQAYLIPNWLWLSLFRGFISRTTRDCKTSDVENAASQQFFYMHK